MSAPRRNVELKATDPDPERSLAVCRDLGAEDRGILVQRDTYFRVPRRPPEAARGDARRRRADPVPPLRPRPRPARAATGSRPSRTAPALREALDAALGTLVVVDKERRLLLWEGVRIHLDTVQGLGSFLELEGVAPADSDLSAEHDRVAQLSEALGLDESRILADSYSDRLLARGGRRRADRRPRAARWSGPTRRTPTSASASRCAPPTGPSTSAPTSRTPPTRSATAPRRPRSAR